MFPHTIFIYSEGSLKKGDEVLMINNKSVVGFRVEDVKILLREADDKVTIIAAAKVNNIRIHYNEYDYNKYHRMSHILSPSTGSSSANLI